MISKVFKESGALKPGFRNNNGTIEKKVVHGGVKFVPCFDSGGAIITWEDCPNQIKGLIYKIGRDELAKKLGVKVTTLKGFEGGFTAIKVEHQEKLDKIELKLKNG